MSDFERLPTHIVPINYNLVIRIDSNEFKFYGIVSIDLKIKSTSEFVLLNSVDLLYNHVELEQNGVRLNASRVECLQDKEVVLIGFNDTIKPGDAKLILNYTGCISDTMTGLYKAKYIHPSGEERYTFTTQFEATDARKCFPCFDEPSFKATFEITLITEDNKTVLSNMPLKEKRNDDREEELRQYIFEKTPIMSTYLVAFVIGEYSLVEEENKIGLDIKVYTPLNQQYLGTFALDIAKKSIVYFEKFYGIKYPLPKLDLIAVPENPIEAMENFSLIIFNQPNLLLDVKNCTNFGKIMVAYVITHEIAHQWFGNLVTMEYWNDLWLNEGFATYMGYSCTNYCLPHLDLWCNFIVTRMKEAFYLDYLSTSHPIEIPIKSPSEINEIFDAVTYSKGASIIRMLLNYIGEDTFMHGINNYLKKFEYSNAKTIDLWKSLSDASKLPINELMETWTKTSGYPVVSVEHTINLNGDIIINFKQNRLFSHGIDSTDQTIWKIPITIKTSSSYPHVKHQFLLEKQNQIVKLEGTNNEEFILINSEFCGFFVTNYSKELFDIIKHSIENLNPHDRIGLQNEAFVLASIGILSIENLFDFVSFYKNETNGNVLSALVDNLFDIAGLLYNTSYFCRLEKLLRSFCSPIAEKLGWIRKDAESELDILMRETCLHVMCVLGDNEHQHEALKLFREIQDGQLIDINLKKPIFSTVIQNSINLRGIFDLYLKCTIPEEKMLIMMMLREIRTEDQIKQVCEFGLNEATFEDAVILLGLLGKPAFGTHNSTKIVWNYIKKNWKLINKRYSKSVLLGRLLKPIIENFSSEEDLKDVQKFFIQNEASDAQTSIKQGVEKIQQRIKLLKNLN